MTEVQSQPDRRFSVAPMMDWTDRHFRYFLRLISRRTLLYTEMVHARAILQGQVDRLLAFSPEEHPVALQLGGSEPGQLAEAARIGESFGYDEINLNVGCPSDRVQAGRFGACLMLEPETVARSVAAMQKAVSVPVTVKCRIGVDDQDSEASLRQFIGIVSDAGCRSFTVHARKAWLQGLSPKQNREVPPLDYELAQRVSAAFSSLEFVINGGIKSLDTVDAFLKDFDGVMIGREACGNPWMLSEVDQRVFGKAGRAVDRATVAEQYAAYCARMHGQGQPKSILLRNIHGLFQGVPGARQWRRTLAENMNSNLPPQAVIQKALDAVPSVTAA